MAQVNPMPINFGGGVNQNPMPNPTGSTMVPGGKASPAQRAGQDIRQIITCHILLVLILAQTILLHS